MLNRSMSIAEVPEVMDITWRKERSSGEGVDRGVSPL
jgi:hypothetical protein